MNALSNSFLRSILLFLFNQDLFLSGKFSYFTNVYPQQNQKKCEGMRMNSTHFFLNDETTLLDFSILFFFKDSPFRKSRFLSQQPNEQWMLSFFKWQRVFLIIPLLSSGPTFPTSFLLLSFHFHDLYPLCVKNIPPIIILPFQFIRFFSFPSFLRLFQI